MKAIMMDRLINLQDYNLNLLNGKRFFRMMFFFHVTNLVLLTLIAVLLPFITGMHSYLFFL